MVVEDKFEIKWPGLPGGYLATLGVQTKYLIGPPG